MRVRMDLSDCPSLCGWWVATREMLVPKLAKTFFQSSAVNWGPLSEITRVGAPCSEMTRLMKRPAVSFSVDSFEHRFQNHVLRKFVNNYEAMRFPSDARRCELTYKIQCDGVPRRRRGDGDEEAFHFLLISF